MNFLEVEAVSHTNLSSKVGFPFNKLSNNISNAGFALLFLNDTFDDICLELRSIFVTRNIKYEKCINRFEITCIVPSDNINVKGVIEDHKNKTIEFINKSEIEIMSNKNIEISPEYTLEYINNCTNDDCISSTFIYIYHRLANPDMSSEMLLSNLNKKMEEFDRKNYPYKYTISFLEMLYKYRKEKIKEFNNLNNSYSSYILGDDSLSLSGIIDLVKTINTDKLRKRIDTKFNYIDQLDENSSNIEDNPFISKRNKIVKQLRFEKNPKKRIDLENEKILIDTKLGINKDIQLSPILENKGSEYLPDGVLIHTSLAYITENRQDTCRSYIVFEQKKQMITLYGMNKCLNNIGVRFIVCIVSMVSDQGHANAILIDKNKKTIELFEPHGNEYMIANLNKFNMIFEEIFKSILPDYTFIPSNIVCPFLGPQSKGGDNRYCLSWSILYLKYRLKYPDMDPSKLLYQLDDKIAEMGSRKSYIENFGEKLMNYRDKYLKERNFTTWNEWNLGFIFSNRLTPYSLTKFMFDKDFIEFNDDSMTVSFKEKNN